MKSFSGGYILCGDTGDTGNNGVFDGWLVSTDSAGSMLWSKTFGNSGNDYFENVLPVPDGGYVVCGTTETKAGFTNGWLLQVYELGNAE